MSDLLSEDELKALSEGVADGTIPVDTGYNVRTKVKKHDLASEDSTLGVNLSSVEMINERCPVSSPQKTSSETLSGICKSIHPVTHNVEKLKQDGVGSQGLRIHAGRLACKKSKNKK